MCLLHDKDHRYDATRPPACTTAFAQLPHPAHTAHAHDTVADGQARRLIVDLQPSPPKIRVIDADSGSTIAEHDEVSCCHLFNTDGQPRVRLAEVLIDAIIDAAEPLKTFDAITPHTADAERQPTDGGDRRMRSKLWDLPHKLHCPVIGTCLDAAELRQVARKAGVKADGRLSDYDVHVSFVSAADEKNVLSLAAHKALEKKFTSTVTRFAKAKTTEQLGVMWEESLARGEVPAGLWATLTHPRCDNALRVRAFEAIHMLSHQIGAGQRADLKRLAQAESDLRRQERDFDAMQKRNRRQLEDREARIAELEKSLQAADEERRQAAASVSQLQHDLAELRSRERPGLVDQLAAELADTRREIGQARDEVEYVRGIRSDLENTLTVLKAENQELSAECTAMERFITESISPCDGCTETECSGNPDLGGRRILCVGGRNRLVDHYRELVARCNGRFEHYDGGLEDNRQRLEALLWSADAIVCATDAVSHDAYYRLKRFCKRNDKPHVFLRTSGISTFTRALYSMVR